MAALHARPDEYSRELGRLVCDRLGLDPATVAIDYTAEPWGEKVAIQTSNFHFLPAADWAELQALAATRTAPRG